MVPLFGLEAIGLKHVTLVGDPLISTGGGWATSEHVTTVWTLEEVKGVSLWSVMLVVWEVTSLQSPGNDAISLRSAGSDVMPDVTGDDDVMQY